MLKLISLTTLATLAIAVPAFAGAASSFTGTTAQGLPVSFDAGAKKVTNFKAKVRCTGKKATTFKFPTIPLGTNGRFSVHQAGPSIDGIVRDNKARGTLTLPGCQASANEVKFTATG